jgi:uncharacterized membrane protein
MPSKYDTNPLDPDFPEKARAAASGEETTTLPYRGGETRQFPPEARPTEEQQTRRFAEPEVAAYSATYNPPYTGQAIPAYRPASYADVSNSGSRRVEKIGLPENILTAVPYIPITLGLVAGLILLLLLPKSEPKVRFHAAQGLAAHLGILLITFILGLVSNITGGNAGSVIFTIFTTVMLIIFTIKAWRGKPVHIAPLDDLTNFLEEKISLKS